MNLKNKNGFITIYVLITMIFLITIITISLISVSGKIKNQTQINSEIFRIYNQEEIGNQIINDVTEIPIYTQEHFECFQNWINDSKRNSIYMQINENFYLLDSTKDYTLNWKYTEEPIKWRERGLEDETEPNYIQYNKEYSNLNIELNGRDNGYVLGIFLDGSLYNSFDASKELLGQYISPDKLNYYINNNLAYVSTNYISYTSENLNKEPMYIGIKFKPNGEADVYWAADGLITDITGLTPVGTISVNE